MSDIHTSKFHLTESLVPSLSTPSADVKWNIISKKGLTVTFQLHPGAHVDVEVKAADGNIEFRRRITCKDSGLPPFPPIMTQAQERIMFKYAWPSSSRSAKVNQRFQIRLPDVAASDRIRELLTPYFVSSAAADVPRQRAIAISRQRNTESQTPVQPRLRTLTSPRGRQSHHELSRDRSYTQSSESSVKSSRRRDERSASPASLPDSRMPRYCESPPSGDAISPKTVRPSITGIAANTRSPRARSQEEPPRSLTPTHRAQENRLAGLPDTTLLESQRLDVFENRSTDETDDQIDLPALQPTLSQPDPPIETLIDLGSSPPHSFLHELDVDVKPSIWHDLPSPGATVDLIRLKTAMSDETERNSTQSSYEMSIMQPTSSKTSDSSATQSARVNTAPNYDIITPYSYDSPLLSWPPLHTSQPAALPLMPAGQRLYDLRSDDLEKQLEGFMRERGLEDLVIRIGEILTRRGPDTDRFSSRSFGWYEFEGLGPSSSVSQSSQLPPSQPQPQPFQYIQPHSLHASDPQACQRIAYTRPQYPHGQGSPAWMQQQVPQRHSRWPTEDSGLHTADTTLDDDFDEQLEKQMDGL